MENIDNQIQELELERKAVFSKNYDRIIKLIIGWILIILPFIIVPIELGKVGESMLPPEDCCPQGFGCHVCEAEEPCGLVYTGVYFAIVFVIPSCFLFFALIFFVSAGRSSYKFWRRKNFKITPRQLRGVKHKPAHYINKLHDINGRLERLISTAATQTPPPE
jgi:hypothetical protein